MKRLFCGICALIFTLSVSMAVFALPDNTVSMRVLSPPIWMSADLLIDNENVPVATDSIMRSETEMGFTEAYANAQKFTNRVDGYSVVIPSGMSVNMSLSDICTTFEDSHRRLRIFKETFDTAGERLSYLNYSNKFIENSKNHTLEKKETYTSGNREYHILQWSRSALKKVPGDKNHYVCIDVCEGARVYTFFFTSDTSFSLSNSYMDIVNSLVTFDPSIPKANAYNRGYKTSDLSHMSASAQSDYNYLFADDATFKMGMFPPDKYGGFERMEQFEQELGYEFCSFLLYTEFTDKIGISPSVYEARFNSTFSNIEKNLQYAQANNKVIELTLQTPLSRNTDSNMVYEILNGDYDKFLTSYTKIIAKYPDVTVLFRPFNEMNGDWCTYSAFHISRDPQLYIELYKYLYKKFEAAGCSNAIWVWNPNERSYPNYKWNDQSLYYPGDEYVDVYGITGYNNGTYYEAETWRTFDEIYAPIYQRALQINQKPMMITEFSCSSVGGDKVAWIEDMFLSLPRYDKIKVGIWWHAADYNGEFIARPYFMDTPDGTLEVFDKYLN